MEYRQSRNDIIDSYVSQMYTPDCSMNKDEFWRLRQCPQMIYKNKEEEQNALIKKCQKKSSKSCDDEIKDFVSKMMATMLLRYEMADINKVNIDCQAGPAECIESQRYELKIMFSHNDKLMKELEKHIAAYDKEYANDLLARRRQEQLLEAINNSSQEKQFTCHKTPGLAQYDCK